MSRSNHFIANARTVNVLTAGAKTANSFVADSETVNTLTANQVFPPYTFTDDFNRSDRDLDGDNGWEAMIGGVEISNNTAVATDEVSTFYDSAVARESNTSDVTVKLDTIKRYTTVQIRQWAHIRFRCLDSSNYFSLAYTAGSLTLQRVLDNGPLQLGAATVNIQDDAAYSMSVVCVGDGIQCLINGASVISVTNSLFQTETKHGFSIRTLGAPLDKTYVDNFEITEVRA